MPPSAHARRPLQSAADTRTPRNRVLHTVPSTIRNNRKHRSAF